MRRPLGLKSVSVSLALLACIAAHAEDTATAAPATNPAYDATLAQKVGADEMGMRKYVLVILKTSAKPLPAGPERDAMFRGHFANMKKLADAGQLAFAGPFGDKNAGEGSWRGMFVFAVPTIEEAKALTATDPVLQQGEMVAEYHELYGSASLMLVPEMYLKVAKKPM
jgi:uncharacterized protein YciI